MSKFPKYISDVLCSGGVGVIPTDTIYGIVGSAMDSKIVERIYKLRERNSSKPFIVLISSVNDLKKFGVKLDKYRKEFLREAWPGPISVILPVSFAKYKYIHRGTRSIAFRVPDSSDLRELLKRVGPLVAPSANLEGKSPAKTIKEAQNYFGPEVDFYMDAGRVVGKSSTLVNLLGDEPILIRK